MSVHANYYSISMNFPEMLQLALLFLCVHWLLPAIIGLLLKEIKSGDGGEL